MHTLPFKQVDVFTRKPFLGNPVAVVVGAEGLETNAMQRIAAWTNLSETTFVSAPSSDRADYRLRIFTPRQELPFAGHPTIGSAHAVIESGFASPRAGKLRQECLAGILDLTAEQTGDGNQIFVQAPQAKITTISDNHTGLLAAALRAAPAENHRALRIDIGVVWLVADMGTADAVAGLKPDFDAIARVSGSTEATGLTVFGQTDDRVFPFHVRSFAPLLGVSEDPVCGSGNASVAAFLKYYGLLNKVGNRYDARQGMQVGRDGQVAVRVDGDIIQIGGYSVTCVDGSLSMA